MVDMGAIPGTLRRKRLTPEQWQPARSVDIGLRIAADGRWYYRDSVVQRMPMVRLFCALLRVEEDGRHYVVTPHVKHPVVVEDAPFLAVQLQRCGAGAHQRLIFTTHVDDPVTAGPRHPIRMRAPPGGGVALPYIEVRNGLYAKPTRSVYYQLAEWLQPPHEGDDEGTLGVYSDGRFFPLIPAA